MEELQHSLPSNLFAEYAPRAALATRAEALNGLLIRPSMLSDRDALAVIAWRRNGGTLGDFIAQFERDLNPPEPQLGNLLLTALINDRVAGFANVWSFQPPDDAPANVAPAGYYLGGVTVDEGFRRRGIGHELTRVRLEWIAPRRNEAYYFANILNRSSIDLHARFGFVELTRDFWLPGASFVGGVGILFRAVLPVSQRSGASRDSINPPKSFAALRLTVQKSG